MRALWLIVACAVGSSCASVAFTPPAASAPHAVVRYRFSYANHPGADPVESARFDGRTVDVAPDDSSFGAETRTVRVPVDRALEVHFSSSFLRTRPCKSTDRYPSCVQRLPDQPRRVSLGQGRCDAGLRLTPAEGREYLLVFHVEDDRRCVVRCSELDSEGAGSTACP